VKGPQDGAGSIDFPKIRAEMGGMKAPRAILPLLLFVLDPLVLHSAEAATGFKMDALALYQPDPVLQSRLTNAQDLADYVKRLEKICTDYFATTDRPQNLAIVVAVKPGKLARVWFVPSAGADAAKLDPLRKLLEAAPAAGVFGGPVAFAMSAKIAGGAGKADGAQPGGRPPIPKEWQDAAKDVKAPMRVPDDFLAIVWPDAPDHGGAAPAPPDFVNQVLEPTGGRIFRPQDWFYAEGHHGPVYMWTISRENTEGHKPYTTGVRIQLFTGIKKATGKTPKDFLLAFVDGKKKAEKALNSCEPKEQGLFTRMCLETEEGPYHILYSLFWSAEDLDMAVVSISGTTKEQWETFAPIFNRMSEFDIIDMKRFSPAKEVNPPMTRIESRQISEKIPPDTFAAQPKVLYRAGATYMRMEEQLNPKDHVQQLIFVHEPDIWICNLASHEGEHQIDPGPTYVARAPVLTPSPTAFSTLEFGNEKQFFAEHHATALPPRTLDGQACDVAELRGESFRLVLFSRTDTRQPFHLDVFKDDKPDFSVRYLHYQTGLPFDGSLFAPAKDLTITEAKARQK